jgi:serine/threonine protein kinase
MARQPELPTAATHRIVSESPEAPLATEVMAGPPPDPVARSSAPPAPTDIPKKLGHYKLVKTLGSGGMGLVYLAEDTQLGRRVAVKVMKPEAAADLRAKDRFLREAQAAAAVRNDHVVTVYQVGENDGVPFIAMELLRGLTLESFLEKEARPSMPVIARLGREVAEGLSAAHAKGLIHRDVKPANVWLEAPAGRVKLLDFGLARPATPDAERDKLTEVGYVMGTPAFMSPEQARGKTLDGRTDLFSLGSVLYLLCTGRRAFDGVGMTGILTALAVDTPRRACEVNPKVPESLSDLIDKLLAKDPANRPANALEVVKELKAIERGQISAAKTPLASKELTIPIEVIEPELPRQPKTKRRKVRKKKRTAHIWMLAGACAALALIVGVVIGIVASGEPAANANPPAKKPAQTSTRAATTTPEAPPEPPFPKGFEPPPPPGFPPPPPKKGFGPYPKG